MRWLVFSMILAACAGKSVGEDGETGIDSDRRLSSLSDAELGELCDWSSDQYGGYGVRANCSGMTAGTPNSRDECVSETRSLTSSASCSATVGQYENCVASTRGDLCRIVSEPSCVALFGCL